MKNIDDFRKVCYGTYRDMILSCCNNLIRNDSIFTQTYAAGYEYTDFCGQSHIEALDTVQWYFTKVHGQYIISAQDAATLAHNTNESVVYCDELELYILNSTVPTHLWDTTPATWMGD